MTRTAPLFEINFVISDEVVADVDAWIQEIVEAAARREGIDAARIFETTNLTEGLAGRTCQFQVSDDSALAELLDGYFSDIDAEAKIKFGDQIQIDDRTLHAEEPIELPAGESAECLNCGTRLKGQYCGRCGQRSRSRLISIWQLLREAFGDLLELDSRLWQTLVPLLTRPGQLTRDYLEGRRARYMPPFRTYLVLSVLFFVVAFFDPQDDLGLLFEPEPEPTPSPEEIRDTEESAEAAAAAAELSKEAALKKLEKLNERGVVPQDVIDEIENEDDFSINLSSDGDDSDFFGDCENAKLSDEDELPEWVKKRFTDERVKQICLANKARGQENFTDAILDNIPVALIVLLPLMALVLKLLYPLSRRYFVEHLLFFVHFHAFFFLILMLQVLFARITGQLGPEGGTIDSISMLIRVITSFYIPIYLYKAMRRVYGQGHLITTFKYLVLSTAYLTGGLITMLSVLFVAVLSA
jgi:hypothetical protein